MKSNFKKIISLLIAVFMILPIINANIKVYAANNYLTVYYSKSHADFETAFGTNPADRNVYILTVTGDGQLTKDDCNFIKTQLPNIISLNLSEATFENNKIPDEAFKDFSSLQSLAIPANVTEIGASAFANCINLFNVGMGGVLQTIGANAFSNCFTLEMIMLPEYTSKIGDSAFYNCSALSTVIGMRSNGADYNAASNIFSGVSSKCSLVVPVSSTGYDTTAFSSLKKVEWNYYRLPGNAECSAGVTLELSADVRDKDNNSAKYQWYRNGSVISNATGDTLVINNIGESYAGRYGVEITIGDVSVMFSCIITVAGQTVGTTTFESKTTAAPKETPKTSYDVTVTDSKGNIVEKFDIQGNISNGIYSYTIKSDNSVCLINTGKMSELYRSYNKGTFRFNFNDGGYLDAPFSYSNSLKSSYLNEDYSLSVAINTSQQSMYSVTFTIVDKNGSLVNAAYSNDKFPDNVYLNAPVKDDSHRFVTGSSPAGETFPIPQVKSNSMIKIKLQRPSGSYWIVQRNANFSDIKNHWGEKDILNSANSFIVNGYTDGTYKPDKTLTRAEFCAMLTRALSNIYNAPAPKTAKTYTDVISSDWFYNDIKTGDIMGLNGFIAGLDYNPNQTITREEMAYMITRAAEYVNIDLSKVSTPSLSYTDLNDITASYRNDVKVCTNLGLLKGADGKFMPQKTLTRAESATVLNRLMILLAQYI